MLQVVVYVVVSVQLHPVPPEEHELPLLSAQDVVVVLVVTPTVVLCENGPAIERPKTGGSHWDGIMGGQVVPGTVIVPTDPKALKHVW